MPLNIATPPKITNKFYPSASMNTSAVDRVDITDVCDIATNIGIGKPGILFIDGTKVYYYINTSTDSYSYQLCYTDIKTNTITKTNFRVYHQSIGFHIDPNKKYIYAVYDPSQTEGSWSTIQYPKLYRWDLTNGTSTLMDSSITSGFNPALDPSSGGDYSDYLNLTGTYFYNDTTMYCRRCSDRDYMSDKICNIPIYRATSNNGSLPTLTEIAQIPCCGVYNSYYYYGYMNISIMSVDESQHLIRYILYPTSYNSHVPARTLYYNEYNYSTGKYYVNESYHFGVEIDINDYCSSEYQYSKWMQYFVSNKRKVILPVYTIKGNRTNIKPKLTVQPIQAVASSEHNNSNHYPFGENGIITEYYKSFNYDLGNSYINGITTSDRFEGMLGGAIYSAEHPNGFFTLSTGMVIYVSINEAEEK